MDLCTRYMGLELKHPLVASASPLSESLDGIRRLEDAGASAVVMFSLFEEQIALENEALDRYLSSDIMAGAESANFLPQMDPFHTGTEGYLDLLRRASDSVDIPIIASINCVSSSGWIDYATQMQQAGADGIELNIYTIAPDLHTPGTEIERQVLDTLGSVKQAVNIPVALKLSPFFSSIGNMALRLDEAGADALVLFNRFYQPDFDLERLEIATTLSFSNPDEIRLPLLWIAILHGRIKASLGASRGVHGPEEVIKYLLAGADAVMTASALLEQGPRHIGKLVEGLTTWMEARDYRSLAEMKGVMSQRSIADPSAFERAQYIKVLEGFHNPDLP